MTTFSSTSGRQSRCLLNVSVALIGVAALASYLPARRASRTIAVALLENEIVRRRVVSVALVAGATGDA